MKKNALLLFMILLFSSTINAQENYNQLWLKVERLEVNNLPKSATKIVDEIYTKAVKEKKSSQIVKSLFYRSKFSLILEENAQLKVINDFKKHMSESEFPTKNVLENVLANLYWQYFKNNRYKFYNRTKTEDKVAKDDFRTWDVNTLFEEIHAHFKTSLGNENDLQKIDIHQFSDILQIQKEAEKYSPTLFDFLANNALAFYKTSENSITKPAYQFKIDNPDYLSDATTFSTLKLVSKDTLSLQFHALKTYQQLVKFHLRNKTLAALGIADIDRINFVKQHATFQNIETICLETLKTSEKNFENHEVSGLYAFEIATIYNLQATNYTNTKNEKYRLKNNEALAICEDVIANFPKSLGAQKCSVLKGKIKERTLQITAEEYIPIHTNSRLLIDYKNTNQLFFTAYKTTLQQTDDFKTLYNSDKKNELINKSNPVLTWDASLRNEHDNLQHTTEVVVPKLSSGNYLIIASEVKKFDKNKLYGTAQIQVTDLVLIENQFNNTSNYQVVDRNTGKPIENARIKLQNLKRNYGAHINKNLTTDRNGFASYKSNDYYRNVKATVKLNEDVATFGNFYLNKFNTQENKNVKEVVLLKPFVFTDRSIYRPGQTVYFKAIVIKKQGEKSEVFKEEYITVSFNDANNQEIKKLELKLNEFGSVAGEFVIPNNGLTGEFSIKIGESYEHKSKFYNIVNYSIDWNNSTRFSVEEYKRPKFATAFNPIKQSFKINDAVTVNGFAKAFSGATITDAKVVYRVHRKVQYPSWYYWRRPNPNSSSQEITNGESSTNEKGEFEITFKALPDESVSKKDLPIFTYEISADVTDVNGETRSATTTVKVGYHALVASITVDNKINKNKKTNRLKIDTKNLNGEFVPAKGTLKIYKLQAPKNPQRKRVWSAPDYQDISELEFRNLFPHEPFTDEETDENNWKKGKLVFNEDFNTEVSKEILLKNTKKWISGKYIVILETEDKFGQAVKEQQKITVFSAKENTVADNQLFYINTDKNSYQPNENVVLQVGSASNNNTIVIQIEKNHTIVKTTLVTVNNEIKTIEIPVTKEDIGGFAIKYHYVNYNGFESGNLIVSVPEKQEKIELVTTIFRDKLQPGQDETWSFTVKNDTNDKITAEVLASMYDASLDEFKSHNWLFTPIAPKPKYYSYAKSNANHSFGNTRFTITNTNKNYYAYPYMGLSTYNWFGFSLNNNDWLNRQYLRKIKTKLESERKEFDGTISGIITDKNNQTLAGVSVFIKGTTFGTTTDFDGKYTINVKKGDILYFNHIGYISKEITVNANFKNANIALKEDPNYLDEVVVIGYGTQKKSAMTGAVLRGAAPSVKGNAEMIVEEALEDSATGVITVEAQVKIELDSFPNVTINPNQLYIIDGKVQTFEEFLKIRTDIASIEVLKGDVAMAVYGSRSSNGAVIVTTKNGAKLNEELSAVKARTNLKETAFFFPQLKTNKNGEVSFNFTAPEALTRWKLQLLAHTTDAKQASKTLQTVTQKELMVVPNAPRFLRQGDSIILSTKISNLSSKNLNGFAQLQLTDAITGEDISKQLLSTSMSLQNREFSVDKGGNTSVSWSLVIPYTLQSVQYKIVAKAGDFSDGEQNALPVLTNRMLVTETLPMWVRSNETKTFSLEKLTSTPLSHQTSIENTKVSNSNKKASTSLSHHKLTLEITSNPVWYAVQALPYLMEYPYECAEQTFSRYYANSIASFVANSNPKIQDVFNAWKSSDALLSNLEKNQELKSLLIQETPWLRDAQSEAQQKKRIALLFDLNTMKNEQEKAINKLKDIQKNSGGFPWFKGGRYESNFITQHIATGFGHLQQLGIADFDTATKKMITNAVGFLDKEFEKQYSLLLKRANETKERAKNKQDGEKAYQEYLAKNNLGYFAIQYLYMRSFYKDLKINKKTQKAVEYYTYQTVKYWNDYNLYAKGQIALSLFRNDQKPIANKIVKSLKENSITSDELGMYWKENTAGYYYYQAPVETQALLIETFSEIENDTKTIDNLKIWLLKNKQTNRWKTTKATTEAVYALLLSGSDWISVEESVTVKIGGKNIDQNTLDDVKVEAGTGYFKTSWNREEITPNMGTITLTKKENGIAWGGLYWQYFEDLDKITTAKTPLQLNKKLFLKVNSDTGKELKEITPETTLKVGDLITIRIELRADRAMEFIHMKDMRASGVEPINVLSQYKWQDGLGYYESTKDAATNFFFDRLPKGIYVFEYDVRVNNAGNFSNGITTIQSMYAPEFSSHSKGERIRVK